MPIDLETRRRKKTPDPSLCRTGNRASALGIRNSDGATPNALVEPVR